MDEWIRLKDEMPPLSVPIKLDTGDNLYYGMIESELDSAKESINIYDNLSSKEQRIEYYKSIQNGESPEFRLDVYDKCFDEMYTWFPLTEDDFETSKWTHTEPVDIEDEFGCDEDD